MKRLKVRTDGKTLRAVKQTVFLAALLLILLPVHMLMGKGGGLTAAPAARRVLIGTSIAGSSLLLLSLSLTWLFSRYSPVGWLRIRKKLILFDRLFLKSEPDGTFLHSAEWEYGVKDGRTAVTLYPGGLVKDTPDIGRKLSQYLKEPVLEYRESDCWVRYLFGRPPERYDGEALLTEGMETPTHDYEPAVSYEPVPIYGDVAWDFTSEALHVLLTAPSGSGKSRFLLYLGGMVLKRQQRLYVVDAKRSDFARVFRHSGVPVAETTDEILRLLTVLVQAMEETYASGDADGTKGECHVLIFDEILAALHNAGKKEREEMERLVGQLALKGRAAGFSLVIAAQKLNATDLPKSITEQCQTRLILGGLVSEDTFHQATGLYKKDTVGAYRGGVGKGYAVTPKDGLRYIETPLMPGKERDYTMILKSLRDRGTPYGEGR